MSIFKQVKRSTLVSMVFAAAVASAPALGNVQDGAELAWKYHCVTCHGDKGKSKEARYPNIAGQNALYLESRLKYFRSKVEAGNQMNAQAAPLSDAEIKTLSEYFSQFAR